MRILALFFLPSSISVQVYHDFCLNPYYNIFSINAMKIWFTVEPKITISFFIHFSPPGLMKWLILKFAYFSSHLEYFSVQFSTSVTLFTLETFVLKLFTELLLDPRTLSRLTTQLLSSKFLLLLCLIPCHLLFLFYSSFWRNTSSSSFLRKNV